MKKVKTESVLNWLPGRINGVTNNMKTFFEQHCFSVTPHRQKPRSKREPQKLELVHSTPQNRFPVLIVGLDPSISVTFSMLPTLQELYRHVCRIFQGHCLCESVLELKLPSSLGTQMKKVEGSRSLGHPSHPVLQRKHQENVRILSISLDDFDPEIRCLKSETVRIFSHCWLAVCAGDEAYIKGCIDLLSSFCPLGDRDGNTPLSNALAARNIQHRASTFEDTQELLDPCRVGDSTRSGTTLGRARSYVLRHCRKSLQGVKGWMRVPTVGSTWGVQWFDCLDDEMGVGKAPTILALLVIVSDARSPTMGFAPVLLQVQ